MTYEDFRTGLTFADVRRMLAQEARALHRRTGQYMFVSRSTVLGRWRQIKLQMFEAAGGSFRDPWPGGSGAD